MSQPLTDADLSARLAAIPRSVLTDMVKAARRLPPEYWGDLVADLELAQARGVTGCIKQELHHGADGVVNDIQNTATRNRRARSRRPNYAP